MSQPHFCQQCGHANISTDSFCSQCGTRLTKVEEAASETTANLPPSPYGWMTNPETPREVVPQSAQQAPSAPQPKSNLFPCPDCGRHCSTAAPLCPNCGRPFRAAPPPLVPVVHHPPFPQAVHYYPQPYMPPQQLWNPGVAAVLSFILPGAGQMYKGNIGAGFLWFIFCIIGYILFILPGFILHICCVASAASGDATKRGG